MDIVLEVCDHYFFTPYVYPKDWSEDYWLRQWITLLLVANFGAISLYLSFSYFSYVFLFDKRLMSHPFFLKNQIQDEILLSFWSLPCISLPTCSIFLLEVRGHSKLYDDTSSFKYGFYGALLDFIPLILFTDAAIYWIHRLMHHKTVYKYVHKKHHIYKVATPFASYAFHPLDGFMQSVPYHIYAFAFPLHKYIYLFMYIFVMLWTIIIHDGDYRIPDPLKPYINGSAHHTDHHMYFNYNYGQFFTLWDRIGGSYRTPSPYVGDGPIYQIEKLQMKNQNGCETTNVEKREDTQPGKHTNGYHHCNGTSDDNITRNGLHTCQRERILPSSSSNYNVNVCDKSELRPSMRKKVLETAERMR
ncbi:lathosterol oxidase-like [Anneissia japonica]|uniref:lathosterol oxidase-like n=1 Tax=Anneissia japonica TaxID=1529436 RepID=UPI0014256A31|nr:lathosterol oxidase-like [Anneissia japonica]